MIDGYVTETIVVVVGKLIIIIYDKLVLIILILYTFYYSYGNDWSIW